MEERLLLRRATWTAALCLIALSASADPTKDECADADTRAQVLRKANKLRDARAELMICTSQACPEMIRQDCAERLEEVTRVSPTVILEVKEGSGADLPATKVTMDGQPLLDHLDGRAVPVDVGQHTFVFMSSGHLPSTMHVLINEGDKERRVSVVVGAPAIEQPERSDAVHPTQQHEERAEEPHSTGSRQRIAGVALGTAGIVGLGLGAAFAAVAASSWSASQSECNMASCTQHDQAVSDHNTAFDFATVSSVAFIAGGVLAATGIIVFLAAPRAHSKDASLRFVPILGLGGGGMAVMGEFQ